MFGLWGELAGDVIGMWIGEQLGRVIRRRPTADRRVAAAYRNRSKTRFAGRWRHGHVRVRVRDVAWVADRMRTVRRGPVDLRGLQLVGERDLTVWEHWLVSADTVLCCETSEGPIELAVPRDDLRFLRGVIARSRP